MEIAGKWLRCDDGVTRPVVGAKVLAADGTLVPDLFLVDSGADRTVLSAELLAKLRFSGNHAVPGFALRGISGDSPFVLVDTLLEFTTTDGTAARVRGELAAFTDPAATDMSILGRDVLANFDVILSRRRNEVLLLAPNHQYQVVRA
jgi:Retroviral aspartyl protease